jgi:hypothetical protein
MTRRYKTFYVRNLQMFVISQRFVPGKPFQSGLPFISLQALLTNVKLFWKNLSGINNFFKEYINKSRA